MSTLSNVAIATNALISLLEQATTVGQLLQTANAEGRDLNDVELAQVQSDYTAAHSQLEADIAAKAGGTTPP